ncbi:MAG TPA: hypothetical protein VH415_16405 [Nitrososphaeraceae archaeon]|jgi:hypothetical protein
MTFTSKRLILLVSFAFTLIIAIGTTPIKSNFAFAQEGNATLNILGNDSAVRPSFEKLSEKLSQIAGKLGINATLGSNISKDNITAFLENLQSNGSFSNLMNKSADLVNKSEMNLTQLTGDGSFNLTSLAEKFVQFMRENSQN